MGSTKQKLLEHHEIALLNEDTEINPIDRFLLDNEPMDGETFRTQLLAALNYEDEETRTNRNAHVVSGFIEHCAENGINIPDSVFESFFNA